MIAAHARAANVAEPDGSWQVEYRPVEPTEQALRDLRQIYYIGNPAERCMAHP
jgi:hypothetical protein